MDDRKRPADIPANYVTLLQLQERWKRKQMQKDQQPEEEDNKQKQVQQLTQEQKQRKPQAQRIKGGRRIQRNSNDLKKSDCIDCPLKNDVEVDCPLENDADVVVVAVQGNESENSLTETEREGLGKHKKKKKKKKGRKKKEEEKQKEKEDEEKKKEREKEEEKTMEYGEAREKMKEERIADDAQTPPVKSESNLSARRRYRMMDKRMEYRPKTISALKKGDRTVKIEGKVENVAEGTDATLKIKRKDGNTLEESEGPVEIEEKLRNLSVGKENELLETQNSIVNSSNSYKILNGRNSNRIVNGSNSQSGDCNRNFYGRNVENRVYKSGGVWPRGGQHRGNYGRFSGQYRGRYKGVGNGRRDMIWVKKEEIVDNGEGAGDQSSGNSAGAI